jgi:hypothetical protein
MTTRQSTKGKNTKASPKANNSKASPKSTRSSPKVAKKPATEVATRGTPKGAKIAEKILSPKGTPKSPKNAKGSPKGTPKGKAASPKGTPKSAKSSPKAPKIVEPVESSSEDEEEPAEFKLGDLVDAEWADDGLFYSARVVKVNKLKSGTTYDVEFTQDGIHVKKLRRNQLQSYSEDDEEPVKKSKVSIDDQDYVDGALPIAEEDASVEPDSAADKQARRKKGKRGRASGLTVAEKKRRLNEGLGELSEKQIVTLVKNSCASNSKFLDVVLHGIPAAKKSKKGKK